MNFEQFADQLAEDAWKDKELWPELESSQVEGRPVGKDIGAAKLQLAIAIETIYSDWLEEQNA